MHNHKQINVIKYILFFIKYMLFFIYCILMLIKRRPPQFTGFVENKYRHEHVMITKLYLL